MTTHDTLLPSPTGTQADALGLEAFAAIDRMREALSAQFSGGLSPAALALACLDWSTHLAAAPGKRAELVWKAARKATKLAGHLAACGLGAETPPASSPCRATTASPVKPGGTGPTICGHSPSC